MSKNGVRVCVRERKREAYLERGDGLLEVRELAVDVSDEESLAVAAERILGADEQGRRGGEERGEVWTGN